MTHRPTSRQTDSHAPDPDDRTEVVFIHRRHGPATVHDRLAWTFLRWAWGARHTRWEDGVRALARGLRGLEAAGLITRHTIRRAGEPPLHSVTLTEDARAVLAALSGTSEGGTR